MRKMLVIAVREYQAAVRTKMFLVSLILMPVLMGGGILGNYALRGQVDVTDRRVAVIDRTGMLFETLKSDADEHNAKVVNPKTGKQERPRFLLEPVEPDDEADASRQHLGLSDRIRDRRLFAFIDVGPDVVAPTADASRARVAYYSNNPTYDDIETFVGSRLNEKIHAIRLQQAGIDQKVVARATQWVPTENLGLVSLDEKTGQVREADRTNKAAGILVPVAFMFLMFMVVMVGATPLMQGVLEEKMQRIAEVLLGSVTPFQLMAGKLIGMAGVSLTILTLYVVFGVAAAEWAGYGQFVPRHLIPWFVAYQILAIFMFGSMFSAIGAACSDLKEAQSAFMPVWIVVCIPLFIWFNVAREPTSTFSTVMSLFPPATPMLMIVRQAAAPTLPLWQPLLGVLLTVLTTLLCVFGAGRIFRVGLLMQGQGANFRQMLRWALTG